MARSRRRPADRRRRLVRASRPGAATAAASRRHSATPCAPSDARRPRAILRGMSDDKHLVDPPLPSVRDAADALGIRLARIGAAAATLRGLTDDLREGSSLDALMSALDVVERDIVLA